jgi:hypothetical protein
MNYEIDFQISHIHKTVEVVSSQACMPASAHALTFSKMFRHHLQKSADTPVFADEYFGHQIIKISLHKGFELQPTM